LRRRIDPTRRDSLAARGEPLPIALPASFPKASVWSRWWKEHSPWTTMSLESWGRVSLVITPPGSLGRRRRASGLVRASSGTPRGGKTAHEDDDVAFHQPANRHSRLPPSLQSAYGTQSPAAWIVQISHEMSLYSNELSISPMNRHCLIRHIQSSSGLVGKRSALFRELLRTGRHRDDAELGRAARPLCRLPA